MDWELRYRSRINDMIVDDDDENLCPSSYLFFHGEMPAGTVLLSGWPIYPCPTCHRAVPLQQKMYGWVLADHAKDIWGEID